MNIWNYLIAIRNIALVILKFEYNFSNLCIISQFYLICLFFFQLREQKRLMEEYFNQFSTWFMIWNWPSFKSDLCTQWICRVWQSSTVLDQPVKIKLVTLQEQPIKHCLQQTRLPRYTLEAYPYLSNVTQ